MRTDIGIAIKASTSFEESLDTLLVLLACAFFRCPVACCTCNDRTDWLAIYACIIFEEHLIFRRGQWRNYTPDDYIVFSRLPKGIAAFFALGCGIAGAVLGMASVWYVGVISRQIGLPEFGGDIGFELSFALCVLFLLDEREQCL